MNHSSAKSWDGGEKKRIFFSASVGEGREEEGRSGFTFTGRKGGVVPSGIKGEKGGGPVQKKKETRNRTSQRKKEREKERDPSSRWKGDGKGEIEKRGRGKGKKRKTRCPPIRLERKKAIASPPKQGKGKIKKKTVSWEKST